MDQFKTEYYGEALPPFGCCLFHRDVPPRQEKFWGMIRCTLFPYLHLYSFSAMWTITLILVYIYALSRVQGVASLRGEEFLRVPQEVQLQLGQNYPFFIVYYYQYYRLIISTLLTRNFDHFLLSCLGPPILGSYTEKLIGMKRTALLVVLAGVGGQLVRNVFVQAASVDSLTPICGLLGFMTGLLLGRWNREWELLSKEKWTMLAIMGVVLALYLNTSLMYRNISTLSIGAAVLIGLIFYFCTAPQHLSTCRIPAAVLMFLVLTGSGYYFFWHSEPSLVNI